MPKSISEIAVEALNYIARYRGTNYMRIAREAIVQINAVLAKDPDAIAGMTSRHADVTKFWMVWTENGNNPRHKHLTRDGAVEECARHAKLNPGQEFYVVAATAYVVYNEPKPNPPQGLTYNWITKLGEG